MLIRHSFKSYKKSKQYAEASLEAHRLLLFTMCYTSNMRKKRMHHIGPVSEWFIKVWQLPMAASAT